MKMYLANSQPLSFWASDQVAQITYFEQQRQKFWKIIEQIEQVKGEELVWATTALNITEAAWNRVIHAGIKPVTAFAHHRILQNIPGAINYYRRLAMMTPKSLGSNRVPVKAYEQGEKLLDAKSAFLIAAQLNQVLSQLIERDKEIDAQKFSFWHGMAAGWQAKAFWRSPKVNQAEVQIKGMIEKHLRQNKMAQGFDEVTILLNNSREIAFSSEPDIAIYQHGRLQIAVEVKGGIGTAAVLERLDAAIKSLKRAKEENPKSVTILIMQEVSFTERAKKDLQMNKGVIDHFFMLEKLIEHNDQKEAFFELLKI